MNLSLFSEFSPTNKAVWKQQVIKDLKGKDFNKTLVWQTTEGIEMQPYYTAEDLTDTRLGELYSIQKKTLGWLNIPVVLFENEALTNTKTLTLLQQGADAIHLDLSQVDIHKIEFTKLLNGIKLSQTPVYFQTNSQDIALINALQKVVPYQMKGGCVNDGLGRWMQTGKWQTDHFTDLSTLLLRSQSAPLFRTVCVSSHSFHNAGANAVQELAFTLASAVTYIDKLTDLEIPVDVALQKVYFSISVGTHYFMEIAKLRALRYLWEKVEAQFRVADPLTFPPSTFSAFIHAQTSTFYDAALSPHTNMIRATTEAMSAVIGGCDALSVHSYDASFQPSDEFSERIARNISIVLKEEAHLDKVADPAAGSYYIESLTLQLIDAAWALFLEVEAKGGLIQAFEQNFIQDQIETNYEQQLNELKDGKRIMVGVNQFQETTSVLFAQTLQPINNSPFKLLRNARISENFER